MVKTIKQLAEEYSFNIKGEPYHIASTHEKELWKNEIENAYKAAANMVLDILYDTLDEYSKETAYYSIKYKIKELKGE